jgi:hypothetical protein
MAGMKILNKVEDIARSLFDLPRSDKKHFSFIVKRNKVLAVGWNDGWKTHPYGLRYGTRFSAIHSEWAAINQIDFHWGLLSECSMINIRLKKDLSLGMSKPCSSCLSLLEKFCFKEVWYGDDKGEWVKL